MTRLSCPRCGAENSADALNCARCRVNLRFALDHPQDVERLRRRDQGLPDEPPTRDAGRDQYQVFAEEPEPPAWTEAKKGWSWGTVGCLAPVAFIICWLVMLFALFYAFPDRLKGLKTHGELEDLVSGWAVVLWGLLFIPGIWLAYLHYCSKNRAEIWRKRVDMKQEEAQQLTQRAAEVLASSVQLASDLPLVLGEVQRSLREAEREFQERAFGPFWDAIEKAARNLEVFRRGVTTVNHNAGTFYKTLERREHSFPKFASRPETLPDPTALVEELRRLVRRGQTDFQFANIWEHRRTREVLIAGFRTLEDGISNLGHAISSSLSELQATLSSRLAQMYEEQLSLRERLEAQGVEHGRMLDNIQRRRKPLL